MIVAVVVTVGSVLAGGLLGMLIGRENPWLRALQTFAMAAVLSGVVVQLLPEAVEYMGVSALVVFAVAVAIPGMLAPLFRNLRGEKVSAHGLGVEFAFLGFLAHQLVEGLALGTYAGGGHEGHRHDNLVLAVAAHTLPLTAIFISEALVHRGRSSGFRRVLMVAAATLLGFGLAGWMHQRVPDDVHSWLSAGVAGFLVHVIFHGHGTKVRQGPLRGALDVVAATAGFALPFMAVSHDASTTGVPVREAVGTTFVELMAEAAPMLLLGLVLAVLLRRIRSRTPRSRGILRGIAAGPETLTLTIGFLGWSFALVRLSAALALALFAALGFSRSGTPAPIVPPSEVPRWSVVRAWEDFDALLLRTAPWMLVGSTAAAFVHAVLPAGSLAPLADHGVDLLVVGLLALPLHIGPASVTPLAAILLLAGISPGAVLAGLLLGPATSFAKLAALGRTYGTRTIVLGFALLVSCLGLGYAVNALGWSATVPGGIRCVDEHGAVTVMSIAVLGLALIWQLWRGGLGPWFAILEGREGEDDHDHD